MDKQLVKAVLSMIGLFSTGFFFLLIWIRSIVKEMEDIKMRQKDRITYDWFEKTFKPELKADLTSFEFKMQKDSEKICDGLEKLELAIMGAVDKKGVVTILHEHTARIKNLEKVFDEDKKR